MSLEYIKKRHEERIPVHLHATIVLAGKSYQGLIQNLSVDGAGSSIISATEIQTDFLLNSICEVSFQDASGQPINLRAELIWFSKSGQGDGVLDIGMRVNRPPSEYRKFIQELYEEALGKKTKDQLIGDLTESRRRISELEELVVKLIGPHIFGK